MKISTLKPLIQRRKVLRVFDTPGGDQWLSDGTAAYPVYNLPELDEKAALAVLDIPPEKWAEISCERTGAPAVLSFDDVEPGERMLPKARLSCFAFDGVVMNVALTSKGLRLYNPAYLKPLTDDNFELYERKTEAGEIYLAAKAGLILKGLIMTIQAPWGELYAELANLADKTKEASQSYLYQVDPATGEVRGGK